MPDTLTQTEKPPYRVPTMDEIRAIPWNGYRVVSCENFAAWAAVRDGVLARVV